MFGAVQLRPKVWSVSKNIKGLLSQNCAQYLMLHSSGQS